MTRATACPTCGEPVQLLTDGNGTLVELCGCGLQPVGRRGPVPTARRRDGQSGKLRLGPPAVSRPRRRKP